MKKDQGQVAAERRWRERVAAVLFLALAAYAFLRSHVYRAPRVVHASALQLRTLDGELLPQAALRGRVVVLNFWAPWCPPCREEMPWLSALQRAHPEIAVVGIEDDLGAVEGARALAHSTDISYRLAVSNDSVHRILGTVPLLPTTLYLSISGRIVHTVSGAVPESVMRGYLSDTLASH